MPARNLAEYVRKRRFDRTPEPRGRAHRSAGELAYVIQKHDATRLHYDVRLELGGVMKSWAVPKGPSLDPSVKRMAVHVEDHPIEYNTFEGVIPKGEYGGGPVLLWDRGRWVPKDEDPEAAYRKGRLKFRFEGEKLQGGFTLVRTRMQQGGKESWLLIKEKDDAARPESEYDVVEARPESVVSGRTIEQIGPSFHRRAARPSAPETRKKAARTARTARKAAAPGAAAVAVSPQRLAGLEGARTAAMPETVAPQLATLVDEVPPGEDWLHEIKYDGYRALCRIERGQARLHTRRAHDWTERFSSIAEAAARLPVRSAMLDGEVVVLGPGGVSSFGALQEALGRGGSQAGMIYYAFDLLFLDGYDLRRLPLVERKKLLATLLHVEFGQTGDGRIRYSDHVEGRGQEFFEQASQHGLEGILCKRKDGPYRSGRSRDWLKVKCVQTREFVVCGFTDPEGSRTGFGSLVLGEHDPDGRLVHVGRVGTGFGEGTLASIHESLRTLERRTSPFPDKLPTSATRGVHWVDPVLVAEVVFTERTRDGILRHPSFRGLREDKSPEEIVGEARGAQLDAAEARSPAATAPVPAVHDPPEPRALPRSGRTDAVEIGGVRLTSPQKVLYPEQGITKLQLAQYYLSVADWILPHLLGRPLTLVRCPEGHKKHCFYQKHHEGELPDGIEPIEIQEGKERRTYLYTTSIEGVVALVQMGVLEIHVWGSRAEKLEHPDLMIFDLDPDEGLTWERVLAACAELRERLEALGLRSFVKTTGGKGIHVCVPLGRRQTWDEVKAFSRAVAEEMVRSAPDRYTSNMSKAKRRGRIFIDYLRNGRGATAISAFSTRARTGAPVSMPIGWDELTPQLRPNQWTVENAAARLRGLRRDPWEGFLGHRQSITKKMRSQVGMD